MTVAFFGLGWYVRTRMKLVGSGIALTAVAALLIPLDFFAYTISGGFPPGSWPTVWLVGFGGLFGRLCAGGLFAASGVFWLSGGAGGGQCDCWLC